MKKGAFELGGSDPFIVLEDSDLDFAANKAVAGRLKGNG
jgi:acyl-CoA reductase-like NAD-dependent aldehyde dehydrogenase